MNEDLQKYKKRVETELQSFFELEKKQKAARFRHLNPFAKKGQILFVGSSLMEQFPIYEILTAEQSPLIIYNRGIGGYTIPEMEETLNEQVFDLEPSTIFINIGTNDISDPECSVEILIQRYDHLLRRIRERLPEAVIYVMAYYPANNRDFSAPDEFREKMNSRIEKLNRANQEIEKLSERLCVQFINVNEGLTDETGLLKKEYSIDGIHMYANGYEVVYRNLKPYLR